MPENPSKFSPETQILVDYLKEKIKDQLNGFKSRRNRNRSYAVRIKLSLILLSAIVTILLGLRFEKVGETFTNIAFVISAIITVLAAVEEFFEYGGLWVRYNITFTQLKALQEDLDYLLLRESDEKMLRPKLDELHTQFKNILDSTNIEWLSIRKKDADK